MGSSKDDSATDGDNSGGELPDSDSSLFSEGEKVLAYHGPRIYEAKADGHNLIGGLAFHVFVFLARSKKLRFERRNGDTSFIILDGIKSKNTSSNFQV
ncbi:hypothetical protein RHMOL_Rhmol10G0143100 [Rhododendron molle]|uniref:Uncharacterized protein n=1 Tax=Rhododendron molle TaxID=49168 RepID=A0ACC0M2D0_RHOML|nr:hypothetical protein RHMOL_Rhmol10G0143100 [Rhododendron molle]